MPIKRSGSKESINDWLNERIDLMQRLVIQALQNVGLECVREARINGRYTDRTNNLRSSIGYVIVKNGRIIGEDWHTYTSDNAKGTEGTEAGKRFAQELATGDGIKLIIVAGMPYAEYVEARGYNVLDSAELLAQTEAKKKLDDVINLLVKKWR